MKKILMYLFVVSLLVSCGENYDPKDAGLDFPELVRTKSDEEVTAAANEFSFGLYRAMFEPEDDHFVSPLSLSLALSMTADGAKGETLSQMLDALGFSGMTLDDLNGFNQNMVAKLKDVDPDVSFKSSNSVWHDRSVEVKSLFEQEIKRYYGAELFSVDFSKQREVVGQINRWCSEKTAGLIPQMFSEEIDPGMGMLLLNALYFKAGWSTPFEKKRTQILPFHAVDGSVGPVPMMQSIRKVPYYGDDSVQMIQLPFSNGSYVLTVLLPRKGRDLSALVPELTRSKWNDLEAGLVEKDMEVSLPSFSIEDGGNMKDILVRLGMKRPFGIGGAADFSRITSTRDFTVGKVIQRTSLFVGEENTVAASVSAVMMESSPGPGNEASDNVFIADRPFLFAIEETSTGAILFIGNKSAI